MQFSFFSVLSWQWWLSAVLFIVAAVCSFVIPGLVALSYLKLDKATKQILSFPVGLALWGVTGYTLGWLNLRWLLYFYPLLFVVLGYTKRQTILPVKFHLPWGGPSLLLLILGVITQLIPVWGSGWRTADGISFYFVNIFDGVFHLALSRSLIESFPPLQPGTIDLPVTNYHYLSNLVTADLARIWNLPLPHLYFQFMPMILSLWMGLLIILLMKKWQPKPVAVPLALNLYYFSGEITWIFHYLFGQTSLQPFEVFIDNGLIQLLNPPQAYAKLVFLSVLVLWFEFHRRTEVRTGILLGLLIGTLFSFKVYFGLAATALMASYIALRGLQRTLTSNPVFPWRPFLGLGAIAGGVGAAFYLPTNAEAGGLFWAFLHWPTLWLSLGKLNWNEWWLRLQVYQAAGNTRALVVWYGLAVGIFSLSLFHLRAVALLALFRRKLGNLAWIEVASLVSVAGVTTFIGMNFLQASGGANIFNFFIVALVLLNLVTASLVAELPRRAQQLSWLLILITVVQTVQVETLFLKHYFFGTDRYTISPAHQAGLRYLSSLPTSSRIQTHPDNYLDDITPYIYFFTGQRPFFSGRGILESHNQPITEKKLQLEHLFDPLLTASQSAEVARQTGVTHLFLLKQHHPERNFLDTSTTATPYDPNLYWTQTFSNDEVSILSPQAPQ